MITLSDCPSFEEFWGASQGRNYPLYVDEMEGERRKSINIILTLTDEQLVFTDLFIRMDEGMRVNKM